MRAVCVFLCLLMLALVLHVDSSSQYSTHGSPSPASSGVPVRRRHSGRRLINALTAPAVLNAAASRVDGETQADIGKMEKMQQNGDDHSAGDVGENGEEGLIYNVDYHGVTTHAPPLPRHPRP